MGRSRLLLATLAAYLPAAALPALASRGDLPGGPLDPALLVVPFCVGFAAAFVPWGRLADRHAPGVVVRGALLTLTAASILVAVAPATWLLVAGRALQGVAAAGVPPAVQAALAGDASAHRTGRALSGMMLAVALATLGGPALAPLLADATGWTTTALLLGAILPMLVCLGGTTPATREFRRPEAAEYDDPRGVRAGWLVSALVLGGHWTVLTRLTEALGSHGLNAGNGTAGIAALTGAAGLPLVLLAANASDRKGPRLTMTITLATGAAGFALAATAHAAAAFVATAGLGLAVYWAYLPVVAAQVQRSAGTAARGRAAGGLYASMWSAAAIAGATAALAPSWRIVLLGAAVSWTAAAITASRTFLGAAQESPPWPHPAPQPSPR